MSEAREQLAKAMCVKELDGGEGTPKQAVLYLMTRIFFKVSLSMPLL